MARTRAIEERLPAVEKDAAAARAMLEQPFAATISGEAMEKPGDMGKAIVAAGRKMLETGADSVDLGRFGPFPLRLDYMHTKAVQVVVAGARDHEIVIEDITQADAGGVALRVTNTARRMVEEPARLRDQVSRLKDQRPKLEAQIGPFEQERDLAEARARHQAVLAELRLKPTPAPAKKDDEETKFSLEDGAPVATLTGEELGVPFRGPEDMPALRRAAQRWYSDYLLKTTATMADGAVVSFNPVGLRESTHGGKGDILLRAVPAIRAIIERGRVVHREPGRGPNVRERIIIAAPVEFMGRRLALAVSVHETPDGRRHYDFTMDRGAGGPGVGVPGGHSIESRRSAADSTPSNVGNPKTGGRSSDRPSLPSPEPDATFSLGEAGSGLNLFAWPASPDEAAVRRQIASHPLGNLFGRLIDAGFIRFAQRGPAGAPETLQAWARRDGPISLVAPVLARNGQVMPVLMHELFHTSVKPLVGTEAWNGLMQRLGRLHRQFEQSGGAARSFYDRAANRVARAGVTGPLAVEEFGAYAIEEYERAPRTLRSWVDDLIGHVKAWLLARFGRQFGDVTPAELRALAVAALRREVAAATAPAGAPVHAPASQASIAPSARQAGIPRQAREPVATFLNDGPMKRHPDYAAAKAGDRAAAVRLVSDLVDEKTLSEAKRRFGASALYLPVAAIEARGPNPIPAVLAERYASAAGARVDRAIVQSNRAFHTGAGAMERVVNRATFDGPVKPGGRYVLVDDVTVMGSTLADLAAHVQRGGAEVVGIVTLVNASRSGVLTPERGMVRRIEERFGHVVEDLTGIVPAALTADEATYLLNFRDADALRTRAAAAGDERDARLRAKGVLGRDADPGPGPVARTGERAGIENPPRAPSGEPDAKFSLAISRQDVVDRVAGAATDLHPHLMALVPLNYFSELKRPGMLSVDAYLRTKRDMDTYRGRRHEAMVAIAEDWRRFASANREGAEALSRLMHETTLAAFDPSVARADPDMPAQADLAARWKALPPAAQDPYRRVRDSYVAQQAELDAIILANIDKAHLTAERKVDQAYRSNLDRIRRDASLTEGEKRERIEQLDATRENEMLRGRWAHRARMTRLRQQFESARLPAPYFPLSRFGRYVVTIKDAAGEVVSFSRFEREAERRRWVRENWAKIQEDFPGATKDEGVIDDKDQMRGAMDPRIIGEIDILLGNAGVDADVMDAIWQRYLATMPDLSIRKRYIHRKGRAGYQADALRGFASHMFHGAHQMARLKYGSDLTEALETAAEEARKADDPTRAGTLVNEMRKRHKWVMNPTGSRTAAAVTSAMFVWYRGATPAAAIVNMTQPVLLGVPILGSRLGGQAKAAAAITRAAKETVAGSGSIQNSKALTAQEQAAVAAFYESGLIERSQSHDLAGIGDSGLDYSPLRHKVMSKIAWMFHRAEVWNREVTALAAYRMAREQGQTHREAIDTAHDLTWKVNFDYSNSNRPRILQNDTMKVIGTFQNFQINMWYRLFRDFHQSFKGDTPQARREARYQLAGLIGMMTLMGGVTGLFGYNVLMAIAGLFLGGDDDPFEWKHQIERSIRDLFGPQIGGMILKGIPGHLTGIDLTSRIGMPDFFLREPTGNKDGRAWWTQMLLNAAGVVPSTIVNMGDGFKLLGEGKTLRGAEMIGPKAVRDLLKAYRYANEGVVSRRGDQVVAPDRVGGWDLIAQASGFTPAHIAESFERNSRLRDAQSRVMTERRDLLNEFALANQMNDDETRQQVLERIRRWNQRLYTRGIEITGDSLRQSLRTRAQNAARREDGVLIQNAALNRTLRDGLGLRINP